MILFFSLPLTPRISEISIQGFRFEIGNGGSIAISTAQPSGTSSGIGANSSPTPPPQCSQQ